MSRWIKTTDNMPGRGRSIRDIWVYDSILNRIVRAYVDGGSIYNDNGDCLMGEQCLLWRPFKKPNKPTESEIIAACVSLEGKRKALGEKLNELRIISERREALSSIKCTCSLQNADHEESCPLSTVRECMAQGKPYPPFLEIKKTTEEFRDLESSFRYDCSKDGCDVAKTKQCIKEHKSPTLCSSCRIVGREIKKEDSNDV